MNHVHFIKAKSQHQPVATNTEWDVVHSRIQAVVKEVYSSSATNILQRMSSDEPPLPGLPYPEIPLIAISDPSNSSVLTQITQSMGADYVVNHILPNDATNLSIAMKAILTGFTRQFDQVPRKATLSLSELDINFLLAWYRHYCTDGTLRLVIVLHNFEDFDAAVLQNIFAIFSTVIDKMSLVFVVHSISPDVVGYMRRTFQRSTMALLRVEDVKVPFGAPVLEKLLFEVFFDVECLLPVLPGHGVFEYLIDYFNRTNNTLDAVITVLQIAFLKHSDSPLSTFASSSPNANQSASHLKALLGAILGSSPDIDEDDLFQSPHALSSYFEEKKQAWQKRYSRFCVGLGLLKLVDNSEPANDEETPREKERNAQRRLYQLVALLKAGDQAEDVIDRHLTAIERIPAARLKSFLNELYSYLNSLPEPVKIWEQNSRSKIVIWKNSSDVQSVRHEIKDWFSDYLIELFKPLDECELHEIWYMGGTPFPVDLINPAPRAAIIAALLRPEEYVNSSMTPVPPDTSIMYKDYTNAGKLINAYDWYQAFSSTVGAREGGGGKERMMLARFMRGLHELDYMGFIKHTERKADHVIRTVFDVGD